MRSPCALAVVFLFSLGCGLASGDAALHAVPSDGVSGFGEAGPVEICLGAARVVAPEAASGAGAICIPEAAAARPCEADAACAGIERCICGRCIVLACQTGAACAPGEVCRGRRCTAACAADAACPPGERCLSGGCARPCSDDAGCHFGERCDGLDGACVTALCDGAASCGPGATCAPVALRLEAREPELAAIGGATRAFFELRAPGGAPGLPGAPGAERAIYRARVASPRRWVVDPETPALAPPPGEARVGAPSVLAGDGSAPIQLFAALGDGAAIVRAVSTDGGASFTLDPAPILAPAAPWEEGRVGSPAAVAWGGATWLFYEAGARRGVGLARVEGGVAERAGDGPALSPADVEDPPFWRAITEVGAPYALADGDVVRLYFTARGVEGSDAWAGGEALPAEANDSIGLVTTRDLVAFARYPTGPVLARVTNLRSYLGEREAVVRRHADGADITFVTTSASSDDAAGLSTTAPAH